MKTSDATPDWRERKKAQTRRTLQEQAMRLFLEQGYEATTVEEIANAAGVSHMTFFRYFPTKEDAALADDYDPVIAELIAERPADESAIDKIRHALIEGLKRVYTTDRDALLARNQLVLSTPALRARTWERQVADQELIARALSAHSGYAQNALHTRVVAAACLAAAMTAISVWTESNGTLDLPGLINEAFDALRSELR
ncbi:TetR family transcriptional regulator [Kitasatospora cystarginea]|uniref:TetR family transcriptional regulator n=1 Tax=Kitasatospora cystarginea TaxID=58350 RepID=A0ABP5RR57_9ACTN